MPAVEIPLNLSVGELLRRPNRFIFYGIADGREQRWHCPVTGTIGMINDFHGLQCLFTPAEAVGKRTTHGTVEAISLNGGVDWIGINQNRINGWVESLLRKNALSAMIDCDGCNIRREVKIDNSRIDIAVENGSDITFLELKTPTRDFLMLPGDQFSRPPSQTYFDRGLRHFATLAKLSQAGHRTIVALCFMYKAIQFGAQERTKWNAKIIDTITEANRSGVENWQINLKITPTSLSVTDCKQTTYRSD
ncbi:MAG: DNA/RNA nuclease SfsA [Puniceicoccales bacterium]|jgi:DNA-binding sugar fermentation-stimulating protein|nr:DNA/RNA nuclease SfsA [Puniceicoccales bacterium]